MASTGKRKTTMAKLAREGRLRERRMEKQARKDARRQTSAEHPAGEFDEPAAHDPSDEPATHDPEGDGTDRTLHTPPAVGPAPGDG